MPQSGDGDLSQSKPIWAPIWGGGANEHKRRLYERE
jgi:hypothetical protein